MAAAAAMMLVSDRRRRAAPANARQGDKEAETGDLKRAIKKILSSFSFSLFLLVPSTVPECVQQAICCHVLLSHAVSQSGRR